MNRKFLFSILTILFLFGSFGLYAQSTNLPISAETNLITYTKIIELPGVHQNDLYHNAYTWCNEFYKNPGNVIRKKDVLNGEIVCKGRFRIKTPATKRRIETPAGIVQYTLTLLVKDNKYRYTITAINWKQTSYYPIERWMETEKDTYLSVFEEYLIQTDEQIKKLITSLTLAMAKTTDEKFMIEN